ncbi:MAG: tetratricopeptide repeat protein [Spirochaetes bacterium]|nr:tetratricopeptide repeat protein [Spirochaetota bacterium]
MKRVLIPFLVLFLVACSSVPEDIATEYYNIGNAYFDVGEYEKAIEYYSKAYSDDHLYKNRIRFNLAVAYTESGRVSQALTLFDLLLEQDPGNLLVLESKAYALYKLGDDEAAVSVYDRILELFEFNSAALMNKAEIIKETDAAESIKLLEKLYETAPDSFVAVALGELYRENDQRESFLRLYEEAVIVDEENPLLLRGLAEFYYKDQLYYKALEFYNKLVGLKNYADLPEMLFRKAEIQLCDLDESEAGFETLILALDSGFSDKQRIKELAQKEQVQEDVQLLEYLKVRGFL